MSILGAAAAVAVAAGASDMVLSYDQSMYLNKISELERLYAMLETHLVKLEELKEQIPQFWEDDEARQAGMILSELCIRVNTRMTETQMTMHTFRGIVEKMDSAKGLVGDKLTEAFNTLAGIK